MDSIITVLKGESNTQERFIIIYDVLEISSVGFTLLASNYIAAALPY